MIPEYKRSEHDSAHKGNGSSSLAKKICYAIFASNLAGMANYLALSVWILQETKSYTLSAAIFGCQWILPLVWPTGISRLTERGNVGMIAARSELGNSLLSAVLVAAVAAEIVPLVIILIIIRGFCDSLTRATASLIIKFSETHHDAVERYIAQIEFWRIVGTSAAGMLFSLIGDHSPVEVFLLLSCAVYVLTGLVFQSTSLTVPMAPASNRSQKPGGFAALLDALRTQPSATRWLWLLGIVSAFQGLHNAIRVAYPVQQLGQGVEGVGIVSAVSTIGVLCGGWCANRYSIARVLKSFPGWLLIAMVGLICTIAVFVPVALPSYAIYFIFMVLFEATFMVFNMNFVASTDQYHAATLLGFRTTLGCASTLLGIAITSLFLAKLTAAWSTLATASILVVCSLGLWNRYKHRRQE